MMTKIYDAVTKEYKIVEVPQVEADKINEQYLEEERQFWFNIPYDEAVNIEIRKRYSESQEFAILRQRDEKPEEYAEYYDYCEQCKQYIKQKKREAGATDV